MSDFAITPLASLIVVMGLGGVALFLVVFVNPASYGELHGARSASGCPSYDNDYRGLRRWMYDRAYLQAYQKSSRSTKAEREAARALRVHENRKRLAARHPEIESETNS